MVCENIGFKHWLRHRKPFYLFLSFAKKKTDICEITKWIFDAACFWITDKKIKNKVSTFPLRFAYEMSNLHRMNTRTGAKRVGNRSRFTRRFGLQGDVQPGLRWRRRTLDSGRDTRSFCIIHLQH